VITGEGLETLEESLLKRGDFQAPRRRSIVSVYDASHVTRKKAKPQIGNIQISSLVLDSLPPFPPGQSFGSVLTRLEEGGFEYAHVLRNPGAQAFGNITPQQAEIYQAELRLRLNDGSASVVVTLDLLHKLFYSTIPPTRADLIALLTTCIGNGKTIGRALFVQVAEALVLLSLQHFNAHANKELYKLALVYASHGMLEQTERVLMKFTPHMNAHKLEFNYNSYALMQCYTVYDSIRLCSINPITYHHLAAGFRIMIWLFNCCKTWPTKGRKFEELL